MTPRSSRAKAKGEADPVVNCPNPSKAGQVKTFKELVQCLQPNRRAVVEVVGTRRPTNAFPATALSVVA